MGLLNLFKKKDSPVGEEKEFLRLQKMVSNKLSQNLDREDALHRLAERATPRAAEILLSRFNWTLDPSIKDQEEKEIAVRGIVAAGPDALKVIRKYCVRAEALTWPLKALRGIVTDPAELKGELLEVLAGFDTDYMRDPTPKVQLLHALSEFGSEEVRSAVQPFLSDMSEEVRFAAVTTVLSCKSEAAIEALIASHNEEESLRVKNRILSGLVENSWKVPEPLISATRKSAPKGFQIGADGSVQGKPA